MQSAGANPVRSRIPRDNAGERYLKRNRDLFNQARDRKETANAERCTRGNTQVGANLVRLESLLLDSMDLVGEDELFVWGSQVWVVGSQKTSERVSSERTHHGTVCRMTIRSKVIAV